MKFLLVFMQSNFTAAVNPLLLSAGAVISPNLPLCAGTNALMARKNHEWIVPTDLNHLIPPPILIRSLNGFVICTGVIRTPPSAKFTAGCWRKVADGRQICSDCLLHRPYPRSLLLPEVITINYFITIKLKLTISLPQESFPEAYHKFSQIQKQPIPEDLSPAAPKICLFFPACC